MRMWTILLLAAGSVSAQDVQLRAGFTQSQIKVGQPVDYYLTARYRPDQLVLFPDTTYALAPFELVTKTYQPTRTRAGESYDSVVYRLRTFSLDSTQTLSLPVFVVHGRDSLRIPGPAASVHLSFVLTTWPDTLSPSQLPVKETLTFAPLSTRVNFPLIGLLASLAGLLLASGVLVFGRPLFRQWQRKKLLRDFARYRASFAQAQTQGALAALGVWKSYMEQLTGTPMTKLTTRELVAMGTHDVLAQPLRALDRAIYGRVAESNELPFQQLDRYAESRLEEKLNALQHE